MTAFWLLLVPRRSYRPTRYVDDLCDPICETLMSSRGPTELRAATGPSCGVDGGGNVIEVVWGRGGLDVGCRVR